MSTKLAELKKRLARVADLQSAGGILAWEQEVMMPPNGAPYRGDQLGTLAGMAHEMATDKVVGELLDDLVVEFKNAPFESDEVSLVRVSKRDYLKKVRIPAALIEERTALAANAVQAWVKAREGNDFAAFAPFMEKVVDVNRRIADAIGSPTGNPYDALVDIFESGLTTEYIEGVFSELKKPLVALIKAIAAKPQVDVSILQGEFDESAQLAFSTEIAAALGYDFKRGRLDKSAHPFTMPSTHVDTRITTRVDGNNPMTCIFSVIHEVGHGMHGQGLSESLYQTGIEQTGLATAESQSRFYENIIGRSRAFWAYWFPRLQAVFPHFETVDSEAFYKAINRVQPSLIRVAADEVTYGLHIMLRFEIENDLLNGRIKVADLPQIWNDRMEEYLGVRPKTDSEGVLQDIHWSHGDMGYFSNYLLGSIFASQLWAVIQKDIPNLTKLVENGRYTEILAWQRQHIHQHGNKFTFPELAERITGGPLQWQPYMDYLTAKYSDIYGL
jgi:carboxypeptidase Taq